MTADTHPGFFFFNEMQTVPYLYFHSVIYFRIFSILVYFFHVIYVFI